MWIPFAIFGIVVVIASFATRHAPPKMDPGDLMAIDKDGDGVYDEYYYKDKKITKAQYEFILKGLGGTGE